MGLEDKLRLLFALAVAPLLLVMATVELSFKRAESVTFCSSCHTMTPWVEDMRDPASDALAARHFRNRWIAHDQCYTCHVDYDFLGPVQAKIDGVRHIVAYYTGLGVGRSIRLYKPFPNENCLQCHELALGFVKNPIHAKRMPQIQANQLSCIKCHKEIHKPHL